MKIVSFEDQRLDFDDKVILLSACHYADLHLAQRGPGIERHGKTNQNTEKTVENPPTT